MHFAAAYLAPSVQEYHILQGTPRWTIDAVCIAELRNYYVYSWFQFICFPILFFLGLLNLSCTCGSGLLDLCTCINAMRNYFWAAYL